MAQFNLPAAYRDDPTVLLVGQDFEGHWIVQENHGRAEGCFTSREAALRYAEAERALFPGALVMISPSRMIPAFGHG